jgi:ATP-dependent DNA helicase RecG
MANIEELLELHENGDFEGKAAQGKDGSGAIPRSFWPTYSAMANTNGGTIALGVKEKSDRRFAVLGLPDIERALKELWDSLHNPQIVNCCLLKDSDVQAVNIEGKKILWIQIPRATRVQRPIYVGSNPLTGTYRRNYEGDYLCDEAAVRRMLAEATEDARDATILFNFGMDDLDAESLALYRNLFRSTKPNHPWLTLDDKEFLYQLGGWSKDRETKKEGLTLAGLLMFGKFRPILDQLHNYVVDYQEQQEQSLDPFSSSGPRWIDRITTDGTWSGNLFDFYRRTYTKLTSDLKIPFRMESGSKRVDETSVHVALREALVNALIHADYTGRVSILVIKAPDLFRFRNPGGLRLPLRIILEGGQTDCRNRNLQKMFQLIGAAEQAGSGIAKIQAAWKEFHWRSPLLRENTELEHTLLTLPMVSLLPQPAIDELTKRFGTNFLNLNSTQRLAVVTAHVEGKITNERLREMVKIHPKDASKLFRGLIDMGFLESDGVTRWTSYHVIGDKQTENLLIEIDEDDYDISPIKDESNSNILSSNSNILEFEPEERERLLQIAASVRSRSRAARKDVTEVILLLCENHFLSPQALGELLGRSHLAIRQNYLANMVRSGQLAYKYPDQPNHPSQAYTSKKGLQRKLF